MTGQRFSADLIARARHIRPLSEIVGRDVKITRRGREWIGLCPFHNEKTPSFTVVDSKDFFHCFGCGAHGDAIAWRMHIHGESFAEAVELLTGDRAVDPRAERQVEQMRRGEDDERATRHRARAKKLWQESMAIAGTAGEGYFRGRGITLELPPSLRYHPRCFHAEGRDLPAVICAVTERDELVAVHRIYLDPSTIYERPQKSWVMPDKALLGSPRAGAIMLAPKAETMGRCEGVETGLSVQQATGIPIWSAISGGQMAKMAIPGDVRTVITFADRDPVCWQKGPMYGRRPGEFYALQAAAKDRAEGRVGKIAVPHGNKADFNDVLVEGVEAMT